MPNSQFSSLSGSIFHRFVINYYCFLTMDFEGIDNVVPEDVGRHIILSFLDVPTLVRKKAVCRSWQILFTNAIRLKASIPRAFQSNAELKKTVHKYTRYNLEDADEFAERYGWPMDRWMFPRFKISLACLEGKYRSTRTLVLGIPRMSQTWKACFEVHDPSTKMFHVGIP
jgi:hypothetical protein